MRSHKDPTVVIQLCKVVVFLASVLEWLTECFVLDDVSIICVFAASSVAIRVMSVVETFLSVDPISSATVHRGFYYLTSDKLKDRRKCLRSRMKKRRNMKMMKRSRKSERTLNSCMQHGDDHGME